MISDYQQDQKRLYTLVILHSHGQLPFIAGCHILQFYIVSWKYSKAHFYDKFSLWLQIFHARFVFRSHVVCSIIKRPSVLRRHGPVSNPGRASVSPGIWASGIFFLDDNLRNDPTLSPLFGSCPVVAHQFRPRNSTFGSFLIVPHHFSPQFNGRALGSV